jgi:hypothetical protein
MLDDRVDTVVDPDQHSMNIAGEFAWPFIRREIIEPYSLRVSGR